MSNFHRDTGIDAKRPGIELIRARLRRQHPIWSPDTLDAHAKVEWHRQNPSQGKAS